jgi:hypothetical protein
MELFDSPLADAKTVLARIDSAADNDRGRAIALSCARSAFVTTNPALGRPIGTAIGRPARKDTVIRAMIMPVTYGTAH